MIPTSEQIYPTRTAYIKEMKEYLDNLKGMPKDEAAIVSRKNLTEIGIIK